MREVAEAAGVAMSSVSRVLSGHPDVSSKMRQRVLAVVGELGYTPNLLAQSLRRQETMSVGFLVRDISNPLMAEIVKAAETRLREDGYSMLLTNSESDPDLDAAHIRLFEQRRVDGLIASLTSETHQETNELLAGLDIPCVVIDRDVPPDLGVSRVLYDHQSGMREAVRYLLDLGHRRIGLILGAPVRPSRERRAALEAVYAERGLPKTYQILEAGAFDVEQGKRGMTQLLDSRESPTAIIVGSNQMVPGALREIAERGIEIPDEISLVGCDDVYITELYRPPIAIVRRDNEEVGRVAAELLLERLGENAPEPRDVMLPTQFTPRASCAAPRQSSPK